MRFHGSAGRVAALFAAVAGSLAVAACGGLGESKDSRSAKNGDVTLSFLVDNSEQTLTPAKALASVFHAQNPSITVKLETRPQGGDGDNVVKTRLATGEMNDVFAYNSGSLFQALKREQNLVPVTSEPWVQNLDATFKPTVSAGGNLYGAPFGGSIGGGVLYNKKVFERWASRSRRRGTSSWPTTPSSRPRASTRSSRPTRTPGLENSDHLSAKFEQGLKDLATGKGAQYPVLTFAVAPLAASYPKQTKDVGFYALPGQDAAEDRLTLWLPGGVYIPKTTKGPQLDAAKKFLAFVASPAGCDVQTKAAAPSGPYMVKGCDLPADVPQAIKDLQPYVDDGKVTPALEFLSPVKGPALEQITVEVGSGLRSATSGAALYDQDVRKQAQQLGLKGW